MEIAEVLVSLDYPHGTAGVVALVEHDGLWLTHRLDHGGGRIEGYRGDIVTFDDGVLQGGRLPDRAIAAEVVMPGGAGLPAKVERGAYIAFFPGDVHEPAPVRFTDREGRLVPVPHERGEPITDAVTPCPACAATSWEKTDRSFACAVCGHSQTRSIPLTTGPPGVPPPGPPIMRRELPPVDFPVYCVAGREPTLGGGGFGGAPGQIDQQSVRLCHDGNAIVVETTHERRGWRETPRKRARRAIQQHMPRGGRPDLSPEAASLWLRERDHEHQRATAAGEVGHDTIPVEGRPVEFTIVTLPGRWAAAADLDEQNSIVISAVGVSIEEIALVAVADLPPPPSPLSPGPA